MWKGLRSGVKLSGAARRGRVGVGVVGVVEGADVVVSRSTCVCNLVGHRVLYCCAGLRVFQVWAGLTQPAKGLAKEWKEEAKGYRKVAGKTVVGPKMVVVR